MDGDGRNLLTAKKSKLMRENRPASSEPWGCAGRGGVQSGKKKRGNQKGGRESKKVSVIPRLGESGEPRKEKTKEKRRVKLSKPVPKGRTPHGVTNGCQHEKKLGPWSKGQKTPQAEKQGRKEREGTGHKQIRGLDGQNPKRGPERVRN